MASRPLASIILFHQNSQKYEKLNILITSDLVKKYSEALLIKLSLGNTVYFHLYQIDVLVQNLFKGRIGLQRVDGYRIQLNSVITKCQTTEGTNFVNYHHY